MGGGRKKGESTERGRKEGGRREGKSGESTERTRKEGGKRGGGGGGVERAQREGGNKIEREEKCDTFITI